MIRLDYESDYNTGQIVTYRLGNDLRLRLEGTDTQL